MSRENLSLTNNEILGLSLVVRLLAFLTFDILKLNFLSIEFGLESFDIEKQAIKRIKQHSKHSKGFGIPSDLYSMVIS